LFCAYPCRRTGFHPRSSRGQAFAATCASVNHQYAPASPLDAQQVGDLADDATAKQQHADDEDHALDDGHPFAETGEVVLHADDDEGADTRSEEGAEPA